MNREEGLALARLIQKKVAKPINLQTVVNIPETLQVKAGDVSVVNQVETPQVVVNVQVDMEPVAVAIASMTTAVTAMSASLADLISALRNQKQPKVENVVNVPQTTVNVAAPKVDVKVEVPKSKKKVTFNLDSDGNATGAIIE